MSLLIIPGEDNFGRLYNECIPMDALQRYNQFGFKPFMTNLDATIEITGDRK